MMGQPAESGALERLSPVADCTGLDRRSRAGRDSCRRHHERDANATRGARQSRRADAALSSVISTRCTSTTTHAFATDTYNQIDSGLTSKRERHTDARLASSHNHMNSDSEISRKLDSTRQSPLCLWRSRRMYMGNIKPWTLSVVLFVMLVICSHYVVGSHSLPSSLSRRLVEQRMRRVSSLDEYISAFRWNNTTRSVISRYLVNRSPTVNKRSYKRMGRAGKDSAIGSRESTFMAKVRDEHTRASCQPRDRVVDAYEELGVPRGYGEFIYPECIVVRRCKQGGCCRDDQECVPSLRTNITMNFLINVNPITREIVHDTQCECQDKPSFCPPPSTDCPDNMVWSYSECTCKCRNRCPRPFLQDETTCGCDCLSQDRTCKNIYRGRRNQKLSRDECDCVRKGLCGKPPCLNGRFSMHDCKCINSSS